MQTTGPPSCGRCVQVSDFGLSRAAATESAMSTNTIGTVRIFFLLPASRLRFTSFMWREATRNPALCLPP